VVPVLMLSASVAVAVLMYANRPDTALTAPEFKPFLVDVAEVFQEDLHIPVQAQGTVSPHRETTLISEVAGRILSVSPSFNAGGYVREGEVLVRIDESNYQANLLRAAAAVESSEAALAQEKGRAEVAYKEWKQLPKNAQRSQDATDLYLRKPQLEQAEAQLLSARADLKKAQDDLDRTLIRAPYDALIKSKRSDLGQYVSPGTPLAEVFATDYAEVRLAIPQSKIGYLELPGLTGYPEGIDPPLVDLYTDVSGEVTHWSARLVRTEGLVDERSRVLFVVARIEDPYALQVGDSSPLRIGTFVKANIVGRQFENLVVLPRYVLRAGNQLWVVDEESKLRNRQVGTLRTEGNEIYVTSGLQKGDLVNLTSLSGAVAGTPVRINKRSTTRRQQDSVMEAAGTTAADVIPDEDKPEGVDNEGRPQQDSSKEERPDQTLIDQDARAAAEAV
jgi:RND family efflux transporter MFP subunit